MKAYVRVNAHAQELKLQEVSIPTPGPNQVLIKVAAFGVGIHDRYFIPNTAGFPYVIGSEGAGEVTETGAEVKDFQRGDRVIFTTNAQPEGGSWAEYAVADCRVVIPIPKSLDYSAAEALPIAGKTALECMRELNVEPGDMLFVAGASGAIGTLVIQLATRSGIKVDGSASPRNHAYMQSLGAKLTVDYSDGNFAAAVRDWSDGGVTAALAIQPGTGASAIKTVRDNGKLITVSGDSSLVRPERGIEIRQMGHRSATLGKLYELLDDVASGTIRVEIEKEYAFEQAAEALEKTETRHAKGKQIVRFRK